MLPQEHSSTFNLNNLNATDFASTFQEIKKPRNQLRISSSESFMSCTSLCKKRVDVLNSYSKQSFHRAKSSNFISVKVILQTIESKPSKSTSLGLYLVSATKEFTHLN